MLPPTAPEWLNSHDKRIQQQIIPLFKQIATTFWLHFLLKITYEYQIFTCLFSKYCIASSNIKGTRMAEVVVTNKCLTPPKTTDCKMAEVREVKHSDWSNQLGKSWYTIQHRSNCVNFETLKTEYWILIRILFILSPSLLYANYYTIHMLQKGLSLLCWIYTEEE